MLALVCEIPYPSTENLNSDIKSGKILSYAYSSAKGELASILHYLHCSLHLKNCHDCADILFSIALAEMKHFHLLEEAILKLGVSPRSVSLSAPNTTCASTQNAFTLQQILNESIKRELDSIAEYNKMLFVIKNTAVNELIQRIILDEQLHLETLKQLAVSNKK